MKTNRLLFSLVLCQSISFALDAVDFAVQQIGKQYKENTSGPDFFDCSGLTKFVYSKVGINIPKYSGDQAEIGFTVKAPFQRGDLVFFATGTDINAVSHVGIYEGNNIMIDAVWFINSTGTLTSGVRRDDITSVYWAPRLLFARRINPNDFQIYSHLSDNTGSIHLPSAIAYKTSVQIGQFTIPNDGKTRLIEDGRMQITARTTSQYQNCLDGSSIYILITNTLDFTTSDWLVGVVIPTPPFVDNQYKTFTEKVYRQLTNFEYELGRTYYVSLMSSCTGAESDVVSDAAGKMFYGYITAK